MVSHAIDDVEDAFSATKDFLLPFDWSRWWRLAVVAFFVASANGASSGSSTASTGSSIGGTFGGPGGPFDGPGGPFTGPGGPFDGFEFVDPVIPAWVVAVIVVLAVFAVVLGLLFAFAAATMQFVLVESIRTEAVHVRRYFRQHWRDGLRLFAFQFAVGLVTVAAVLLLVGLVAVPAVVLAAPVLGVLLALVAVPLLILTVVTAVAIVGFTNAFVVPTMILEETGVLDAWRRFWPVLRENWGEYLAFAVVYVVLLFLAGIVVSIAVAITAFVLLIPFGIVGIAAFALANAVPALGVPLLAGIAFLFFLAVLGLVAFVQVPVVVYFRYYGLFVLGDTDPALDLIENRRRAVRSDDEPATGAAA